MALSLIPNAFQRIGLDGRQESRNLGLFKNRSTRRFSDQLGRLGSGGRVILDPPRASSGDRRAIGPPPGVASESTCFPDVDLTRRLRDRPLRFRAQADVPSKTPEMSAKPPDKRFVYLDCARALPRAPGTSQRFWLGSILKCPEADQRL
jgi:hypothetical protein